MTNFIAISFMRQELFKSVATILDPARDFFCATNAKSLIPTSVSMRHFGR